MHMIERIPLERAEAGRPALTQAPRFTDCAAAAEWLSAERPALREALVRYGAVLIRGLPMRTTRDFSLLRDALVDERADYREKATPRSDFGEGVHSSTDLPPAQAIGMHNENSYTLSFPGTLVFGCLVEPEHGGATPLADVRTVLRYLPEPLVDKFRRHGWCLHRCFGDRISLDWRTSFASSTRAEVERYCAANAIGHRWDADDTLHTTQVRSAVVTHPGTGEEVWFNHAAFWSEWSLSPAIREVMLDELGPDRLPFNTSFGDGTPLTREEVETVNEAYDAAVVRAPWQVGDVLVVDNILTAHGRDPFRGDRQIVVAMGDPVRLDQCAPDHVRAAPVPDSAVGGGGR